MTTGSFGKDRNSIICTACGAANPPGSRFCERCGTRLPQQAGGGQPTRATPAPIPTITPTAVPEPRPAVPTPSSAPGATPTGEESVQQAPAPDEAPAPFPGSDRPTVTIELTPVREITRDAPTQTFELPREGHPASATPASDTPAAAPQSPDAPPPLAGDQPTQVGSGWNYRSWAPAQGGAGPPPAQSDEPPMPVPPREASPTLPTPPAEVTRVIRPTAGAGSATQGQASAQEESPFTAPATAPITYPSGNAPSERQGQPYAGGTAHGTGAPGTGQPYGTPSGGAPPPTGYMANAGQFPAPASGSNNRTLWIILGVIGGLVLLCIIICLLIVVVAAVGSSNTAGVATSVATATRR